MDTISMHDMARYWSEAYDCLPECYQADNCLDVWVEDGTLYIAPKKEEEPIIGVWTCYWDMGLEAWCDSTTCEPVLM
jgi:hypothetical protein